MKKYQPNARQYQLIVDCGADPYRYWVIGEDHGWIYCIDKKSKEQVHFDLVRRLPCYTKEIKEIKER